MKKLAIITSHPIQYNAPFFAMLAARKKVQVKVFYTWGENVLQEKFDPGFGKAISWDIPLLSGYDYTFVRNISKDPGSHHFRGIDNPGLIREIESWNPDAVLIFGWSFKSHLKAMRYFKGKIPVLFRGDSTLLDHFGFLKHALRTFFLKWVYRYIDIALYVGKANRAYFLAHNVKPEQLVYAPHAIDNDRFFNNENHQQKAKALKKQLHIADDALVFLFAAKFELKKDPVRLLKSFKKIEHPNAHLVMVGSGPLEPELKMEAGNDQRVHFLPFQNQSVMPSVYQLGDVFVLPSLGPETWGLAINEAMAAGKAILVSDTCGCGPDLVRESVNGFIFRSGDIEDMRKKLQLCADIGDKLHSMGQQSIEIVKNYNFWEICEAIEDIDVLKTNDATGI